MLSSTEINRGRRVREARGGIVTPESFLRVERCHGLPFDEGTDEPRDPSDPWQTEPRAMPPQPRWRGTPTRRTGAERVTPT